MGSSTGGGGRRGVGRAGSGGGEWCRVVAGGSDDPEHLSRETLDPSEITLDFPSTAGTGIERG